MGKVCKCAHRSIRVSRFTQTDAFKPEILLQTVKLILNFRENDTENVRGNCKAVRIAFGKTRNVLIFPQDEHSSRVPISFSFKTQNKKKLSNVENRPGGLPRTHGNGCMGEWGTEHDD